ncbi:hypothetical protein PVAP13_3KG532501 [Panicum virgatum]|uniref:Uncharacterized protein n=1 Tax=Panicum virgatum TaxID=38727 RepID=A0A8T0V288_PANVG|nr:hypothetical protein PVAP13_3KG532501 [Panicum virgatum]
MRFLMVWSGYNSWVMRTRCLGTHCPNWLPAVSELEEQLHGEQHRRVRGQVHAVLCCFLYSKGVPQPGGFLLLGLYATHARWLEGHHGFSGATTEVLEKEGNSHKVVKSILFHIVRFFNLICC